MNKKYPALTLAMYLIDKASETGGCLTPIKLIKLIYFACGWNLALKNEPLIDEPIEAWQYGPVVASLYHKFKLYGNEEIKNFPIDKDAIARIDESTQALLNKIWEVYGDYTGIQLANMTHEKDSPWYKAWNEQNGKYWNSHPIDDELIKEYFTHQLTQHHRNTLYP